ncbi:MAG: malate synthase, partial [Methanobacteriota archaeon]
PVSASLFDFGLYAFHNHAALRARGSGPYFYLPKLESHVEARLWKEAFVLAEDTLDLSRGTIRATVLIETILAAFEVEEILYELRDHVCGLNAGRWDYIFSIVKKFRDRPDFLLPDRAQVTMTVPFMRAYTRRLVAVCHARGAHAIGGMAAFIPNRRDADVTAAALAAVRADKDREAGDGFDGTWVAHPDLVPVAKEAFDRVLGTRPNQLSRIPEEGLRVTEADLLDVRVPGGRVTTKGLRTNVEVGTRYIAAWLSGTGAAAIHNLMEDAATAEISRSQVFQWIRHGARLEDGTVVSPEFVRALLREELSKIRLEIGDESYRLQRFDEAARVFLEVALQDPFVDFLTIPAYDLLEPMETPA